MRGLVAYGACFVLVAALSGLVTAYLRLNDSSPHVHTHVAQAAPTAVPTNEDPGPLKITVIREDGTVDALVFPAGSHMFSLGDQTWIGYQDEQGNAYDYILAEKPGDVVLFPGPGPAKPAFGPTPIPGATPPPLGPGPMPTPPSNDPAEVADWLLQEAAKW